jgi:hypothetical protein
VGGLTWTYTGINRGKLSHIYWVICDDPGFPPCGVSLDGPITASSTWQVSTTDSNLLSGKLVFLAATTLMNAEDGGTTALSTRLTMTIVDSANSPIPFTTVGALGVTARLGQYGAEIKGTGFTVSAIAEVKDTTGAWTPYLDYYDAAHTMDTGDAGGNAYVSYGGSFYDD